MTYWRPNHPFPLLKPQRFSMHQNPEPYCILLKYTNRPVDMTGVIRRVLQDRSLFKETRRALNNLRSVWDYEGSATWGFHGNSTWLSARRRKEGLQSKELQGSEENGRRKKFAPQLCKQLAFAVLLQLHPSKEVHNFSTFCVTRCFKKVGFIA